LVSGATGNVDGHSPKARLNLKRDEKEVLSSRGKALRVRKKKLMKPSKQKQIFTGGEVAGRKKAQGFVNTCLLHNQRRVCPKRKDWGETEGLEIFYFPESPVRERNQKGRLPVYLLQKIGIDTREGGGKKNRP